MPRARPGPGLRASWPEGSLVCGGPASCGPGETGQSGKARGAGDLASRCPCWLSWCFLAFLIALLPFFSSGGFPSRLSRPPEKNLLCSAFSSCPFPPASQRGRGQQPFSPAQPACPRHPGALRSSLWVPWGSECWGRAAGGCAGAHLAPSCTPHCEVRGLPDRRGPDVPPDAGRPWAPA